MNIANKITVSRIALVPVFMALMLFETEKTAAAALAVFAAASLTDFLDGYLARKLGLVSDLGKFLDPLADKLLVISAFTIFTWQGRMHPAACFIIIARELIITSLRTVAMGKNRVLAADFSGKVKTCVQIAGVCFMLLIYILPGLYGPLFTRARLDSAVTMIMTAVTLWSGADYIIKNRDLF